MMLDVLLATYIQHQQDTGRSFKVQARMLRAFGRAIGDVEAADVEPRAVAAFLVGRGPVTTNSIQKYRVLRRFFHFAITRGWLETSPLAPDLPKTPPSFAPYIYSTAEITRLLAATAGLACPGSPLQPTTVRVLLLLLYSSGIRIGEALGLTLTDVDLREQLLTIRNAKFHKTRLVPIGPRLTAALAAYARQRRGLPLPAGEGSTFFATGTGGRLHHSWVVHLFGRVRTLAAVRREPEARYQPRLHDLRHTAAVHRLIHWYRTGQDLQRLLPRLATYLGHRDLASTQHYLTMTPELLLEAATRFARYAQPEAHDE